MNNTELFSSPQASVDTNIERALVLSKITLYKNYPFLGFLVMSTRYYWTDALITAGATTTPSATIFINPTFFKSELKNNAERCFVLLHELLHIFLEHIGRQSENRYNPELWNVATDYCINSYIKHLDESGSVLSMPKMGLYEVKYKGMSADAIYHDILKQNGGDIKKALSKYGIPGEDGKKPHALDHVSTEELSEKIKNENKQKIASATSQKHSNKAIGKGEGDLLSVFYDMISPKLPWASLLGNFITQTTNSRYTYNKISRKSGKIVFPSLTGNNISVIFGVDTSGSMSEDDLLEAISELSGIMSAFDSWTVELLSCDTRANHIGTFSSEVGDSFSNIDKKLIGGGGTDMSPMVSWDSKNDTNASVVVIITDGHIPEISTTTELPVIFIVTKSGNKELTKEFLGIECDIIFMNDA